MAMEQIHHNLELIRPGATFREISEKAWKVPDVYEEQKYSSIAHGVGLCDEWPSISYLDGGGFIQDGVLVPGMTVCLESYIGAVGGTEGVKLEEQVLITDRGSQVLSNFPYDELLFR